MRLLLATLLLTCLAAADVQLHGLFADHMVLQRDSKVAIWGRAAPGEKVTVSFAGTVARATAGDQGHWRIDIGPFQAAAGRLLKVNRITLRDVCVGDVWVCSGQSNMQWPVRAAANAKQEIATAKDDLLRLFTVPRRVAPEPCRDVKGAWARCAPETVKNFSAVAYFFGRTARQDLHVPIGLIHSSWGGTPAEAWTRLETLGGDPVLKPIVERWDGIMAKHAEWKETHRGKAPRPGPNHPHRAAGLFNGMIAPLIPAAIRGAIWYQGESNANRAEQYRTLFPAMIRDWRDAWGRGDFPFLFVQLANFRAARPEPAESAWAELREAQAGALAEPNTGMAVAIDIGNPRNIHPKNKQEVGRRLWLAYQGKSSPRLTRVAPAKEGRIGLEFDQPLRTRNRDAPAGFAIAGKDRLWRWARIRIHKSSVRVWHPQVPAPVAVRYGWADNPRCNLESRSGLPLGPFRTDDWPGATDGKR